MHRGSGNHGEHVEVIDVPLFRRALREGLLAPKGLPPLRQAEAAKRLRIGQPYLSRLAGAGDYGRGGFRINVKLWGRLRRTLRPPYGEVVLEATLSHEARFYLDDHEDWVQSEIARIRDSAGALTLARILRDLRRGKATRHHFESFKAGCRKLGWGVSRQARARLRLALLRVVEPLARGEGWGIERRLAELSPHELDQFLRSSLRRELLLLSREGDLSRAQRWEREERRRERAAQEGRKAEAEAEFEREWLRWADGLEDQPQD